MADNLYIKHARIANHDSVQDDASIYIEDGKIMFIGIESEFSVPENCKVVDAAGKFVLPGGIGNYTSAITGSKNFLFIYLMQI